jgi:hypothetical protein
VKIEIGAPATHPTQPPMVIPMKSRTRFKVSNSLRLAGSHLDATHVRALRIVE